MAAIKSVGSVLAPYDSDQLIPVFGFGARLPPTGEVSHCFPLTLNHQRPEVYGVQVKTVMPYHLIVYLTLFCGCTDTIG